MDEIKKKTHQTKPKSTFLGCFGFSEKEFSHKKSAKIAQSDSMKKTHGFSWSRLRMKKSGTKTVPVDTTVSDKTELNCKSRTSKSKLKWKFSNKPICEDQALAKVATDQTPRARPQETRHGPAQNINLENRKNLDHLGSTKDDTCPKRSSFCRKIDTIRTGSSHPASPNVNPKPKLNRINMLSQSASFPVPKCEKPMAHSRVTNKKPRQENREIVEKLDPLVGMSIIMVTLLILLLWGRLCAILCTCTWFYFIPRFRNVTNFDDDMKNKSSSGAPNLNWEEYKKKVVLDGLLERNHRVTW